MIRALAYNGHRDEVAIDGAIFDVGALVKLRDVPHGTGLRITRGADRKIRLAPVSPPGLLAHRNAISAARSRLYTYKARQESGQYVDGDLLDALESAVSVIADLEEALDRSGSRAERRGEGDAPAPLSPPEIAR